MTNHLTQAAAQKCADLANEADHIAGDYTADFFNDDSFRSNVAFRRYVERIDARDREVLALLDAPLPSPYDLGQARHLLRTNLLPDPAPTLLEEFMKDRPDIRNRDDLALVETALDWITKREVKS